MEQVESFTPGELGVQGQGQLHRGQGSERQFAAGRVLVVAGPFEVQGELSAFGVVLCQFPA